MKKFFTIASLLLISSLFISAKAQNKVKSLGSVTINFYENENVAWDEDSDKPIATLSNGLSGIDEVIYNCFVPERLSVSDKKGSLFKFMFVDEVGIPVTVTEEGDWHLTINGFYLVDNKGKFKSKIPLIQTVYKVEAGNNGDGTAEVNDIIGEEIFNVFTLNGIQVYKDCTSEEIQSLNPGIYIINGKKVVIH